MIGPAHDRVQPRVEPRVQVTAGFDAAHWIDGDDLYATAGWISCMCSRAGEEPLTIRVAAGSSDAQLVCFHNRDPDAYEAYNLGALVLRRPPVFPWDEEGMRALEAVRARWPGISEASLFPNLTAVLPGYRHPLVCAGPRGDQLAGPAVRALVDLAWQRGAAACGVLYVPRGAEPLSSILGELQFVRVPLTSRAVLPIAWTDLDGYVAWLPRPGRQQVRRDLRAIARIAIRSRAADPVAELDTILRLRLAHLGKFGHAPDAGAERARLTGLVRHRAAKDFRLAITEHAGQPVAALLAVRHRDTLHGILAATDPERAPPLTHFETAYYAPIRTLEPGLTAYDMGIGHLQSKVLRGARLAPLDAWVLAADPQHAAALGEVAALADRHGLEAPVRGPRSDEGAPR
ncbi:MAG TPA: GNAT family N-acetyltransferase [Kofleriaceae bacterium]|nr:GNAT family N-acetyltransferase [Kofleriaceae bacterium]